MTDVLEKFRRLTKVFDPIYKSDEGEADSYYVAETHEDYRRQLDGAIKLNDNVKLLVAGQPGCGKTTLLRTMARTLRTQGRIVAFVDLEAHTTVQDLDSIEMHIATLAELLKESEAVHHALPDDTIQACGAWLSQFQPEWEKRPESGSIAEALRQYLKALRDNQQVRDHQRRLVKPGKPSDPFEVLSRLLRDLAAFRPVIILDGLDKLPPDRATKTFLDDKQKPMAQAPCAAILTIPLSIVYEPTFNVLSERYNNADSAVLPAVRLWDFDPIKRERKASEKGRSILKKIVDARIQSIDPNIISPTALTRAIEGSGGNIRELARLIQASIVKAYVRGRSLIESEDIEAAIGDQRESFRRAFDPKFLPLLQLVKREFRLDDSSDIAKQLLYGLWVMEYRNGDIWYSLPDPVEQLLTRLERALS